VGDHSSDAFPRIKNAWKVHETGRSGGYYRYSFHTLPIHPGDGNGRTLSDHIGRSHEGRPTREYWFFYRMKPYQPITSPLQFPSRLLQRKPPWLLLSLSLLSLIPSTSSLVPNLSSFSLPYFPLLLPPPAFFTSIITFPSNPHHFQRFPTLSYLHCQLYKILATVDGPYSYKFEDSIRDLNVLR
jgi:hypothetical protein